MRAGSHRVTATWIASGFLAGWVSAVWVSPPPVVTQTAPSRPTPAPLVVEMPRVALDRVAAPETRPDARRNPFAFRDQGRAARPVATEPDLAPATGEIGAPPVETDRFPWRLVGLASSQDGASPTAVVSGLGDVHLARVGDRLPDGTAIVAIDGRQVTVRLVSGEARVLDLP